MRRHFLAHRWVWLAIAVTLVVANELIDRNFFDHREHIDGDVGVTLFVLLLSFFGDLVMAVRRRRRRAATYNPRDRGDNPRLGERAGMSCFTKSGSGVSVGLLVKGAARGTSFCFHC